MAHDTWLLLFAKTRFVINVPIWSLVCGRRRVATAESTPQPNLSLPIISFFLCHMCEVYEKRAVIKQILVYKGDVQRFFFTSPKRIQYFLFREKIQQKYILITHKKLAE